MNDEQVMLVGSYHDNCLTETLHGHIDDAVELKRLNDYRPELNWSQDQLNSVIQAAIALHDGWHVWNLKGDIGQLEDTIDYVKKHTKGDVKVVWEANKQSVMLCSLETMICNMPYELEVL